MNGNYKITMRTLVDLFVPKVSPIPTEFKDPNALIVCDCGTLRGLFFLTRLSTIETTESWFSKTISVIGKLLHPVIC